MKNKLKQLVQSSVTRSIILVAMGTAGVQVITLVFLPLITRLYGAETYGAMGLFLATVGIIAPIASLTYPIAIILPKKDSNAVGIAKISLFISIVISVSIYFLLISHKPWLIKTLNLQEISTYIVLIPLAVLFSTWLQVSSQWMIRKKQFKSIAKVAIIQALFTNMAIISIGLYQANAMSLIALTILGIALQALILFFIGKKFFVTDKANTNLFNLALNHYDFPLYRAPQVFINSLSQNIPVIMLAAFFSPTAAGLYSLSKLVLGAPSQLIGKAVGDVLYPHFTESVNNGLNISKPIIKATGFLSIIGIPPLIIVIAFGPLLFGFVFGDEWAVSGEYARWLAIYFFFNLINKPSVIAVPILGIQKGLLFYEIASTSAKLIGLTIGYYIFKNEIIAIALFSIIGSLSYVFMIVWIILIAKVNKVG